jgi:hypothetical protein
MGIALADLQQERNSFAASLLRYPFLPSGWLESINSV